MIELIGKGINNPRKVPSYLRSRSKESVLDPAISGYLSRRYGKTIDHFEADWDNLVILDACRFDMFCEKMDGCGPNDWKLSRASATMEWLEKCINNESYFDTVYVSANPRIARYEDQFHAVNHVWDWGWDDDLKVAPPDKVVEAARTFHSEYPNKRLVVHFMQPHQPFIGDFGLSELGTHTGDQRGRDRALGKNITDDEWETAKTQFMKGEVPKHDLIKAYKENLELVIDHTEKLVELFNSKSVISADHGEMFNEWGWPIPWKLFGHPGWMPALKLRMVPWFVPEFNVRKEIISEPPETANVGFEDDKVRERLKSLGYA